LRHSPTLLTTAGAALGLTLLVSLGGCEDINWPFHRNASSDSAPMAPAAEAAGGSEIEAQCADIRAQIKDSEEQRREAPVTSTDPEIVNAGLGKADKRIEDLRARYDELDCPSDADPQPGRVPPLPPAPGAPSR
jgi:hypothetical protein